MSHILKVETEDSYAWILLKYEVFPSAYQNAGNECTLKILSFLTDRSGQTMKTQIRLLLQEQSDQGLHCLLFHPHLLETFL